MYRPRCHRGIGPTVTEAIHQRHTLSAIDQRRIPAQSWRPAAEPTAVVQVLHGLGEHSDRYARFASAAALRGFAVIAHNHRGHGPDSEQPGYFGRDDSWQALIDDARIVNQFAAESFTGKPVVLLGHSMGSFIAQNYAMHFGGELAGLILSGSTWAPRLQLYVSLALARIEAWRVGAHLHSPLLDKIGFSSHNKAFEPARTENDWLSRDEAEVDKYNADPLCGGPYMAGLWVDVIRGLLEITSDNALQRIPADLPILITGGADDPVGGDKGMTRLLQHYAQTSHQRLKAKIYPEGRHEMLNETNRAEVMRDWFDWIDATTRTARSR